MRTDLRQLDREKIRLEAAAYHRLHPQLSIDYIGHYVAIHQGGVIDSDVNFETLHARVREHFGRQSILLRRVETEIERVLTFRSPRMESKTIG